MESRKEASPFDPRATYEKWAGMGRTPLRKCISLMDNSYGFTRKFSEVWEELWNSLGRSLCVKFQHQMGSLLTLCYTFLCGKGGEYCNIVHWLPAGLQTHLHSFLPWKASFCIRLWLHFLQQPFTLAQEFPAMRELGQSSYVKIVVVSFKKYCKAFISGNN